MILAEKRKEDHNPSCQKNVKKLELSGWKKKHTFAKNTIDNLGAYVEKPAPLIVYMFGLAVFFLLPELLFVLF